jgi:hypothetical protein
MPPSPVSPHISKNPFKAIPVAYTHPSTGDIPSNKSPITIELLK